MSIVSAEAAWTAAVLLTLIFVGGLYALTSPEARKLPRNHPQVMRERMRAIMVICMLAALTLRFTIFASDASAAYLHVRTNTWFYFSAWDCGWMAWWAPLVAHCS